MTLGCRSSLRGQPVPRPAWVLACWTCEAVLPASAAMELRMQVGKPIGVSRQHGAALMIALLLLALMGIGLSLGGPAWQAAVQREREQEWLRIGGLYAQALEQYVAAAPGALRQPPVTLDELLADTRFVGVRRHLRRAYTDPLRPGHPWALLRDAEQRIIGVRSDSTDMPFMTSPSPNASLQRVGRGDRYADWAFLMPSPTSTPSRSPSS